MEIGQITPWHIGQEGDFGKPSFSGRSIDRLPGEKCLL
jgi:hypothetical protein